MVGGVPGAGKSTALLPYVGAPRVRVVDPDRLRPLLRWRPLVHAVHQVLVWGAVLLGPGAIGTLLVQDTATRRRRREALLRLARVRGWVVHLVLVDVSRAAALSGQAHRGRFAPPRAFDRHWHRWTGLRAGLDQPSVPPHVVPQGEAAAVIADLVGTPPPGMLPQPQRRPVDEPALR